ncbi:LysR family transcriptional regulator [Pseudobacter ginsenosidimutans]|uniref:DNA-binding transcriptional LysR family regulator n=1 Tax=Pseudobacter ginsenosidimutans TaxID=661488 RepID=A0A4Q7N273_9BACT|nr:LysR family transcriptional regulator [Pseudobacter ginsenosidimutans]QEC43411.1 LysR family transcriptional regulator [Pseudobacter ginsenosidimutans]RZS74784.1 DNA-binding transcriptional LysR family regulator [Pseudobacter ginsenosidimutans]
MLSIINQIEFRHLSYFKVLAEELHFRKAAEKLFISPSALSQQISQLEDILKTELFERTNKKVSLTDAGSLLYTEVTQLFNKLNSTVNNLELLKKGSSGQIGIGFVASAVQSILPGLLKRFNRECPGIKFQLEELTNKEQLAALQQDEIDMGFMRSNQVTENMMIRSVLRETFSLVLPANHAMTARRFRNIGQLKDESFILFPNDQSQLYYQQILHLCADYGFVPKISHKAIHAPAIFKLVENEMGLSILPTSLASGNVPGVRFIELKNIPQQTELYAVWKKENSNPALKFLLQLMEERKK